MRLTVSNALRMDTSAAVRSTTTPSVDVRTTLTACAARSAVTRCSTGAAARANREPVLGSRTYGSSTRSGSRRRACDRRQESRTLGCRMSSPSERTASRDSTDRNFSLARSTSVAQPACEPIPQLPRLWLAGSGDAVIPHLAIDRRPRHPQGYRRLELVVGVVLQAPDNGVSLKRLHLGELSLRKRSTLGRQLVGTDNA